MAKTLTRQVADLTARDLRDRLKLSPAHISELLNRKSLPSLKLAVAIEREFGVRPAAWIEGVETERKDDGE